MIKKWKANLGYGYEIESILVEKETEHSVWINGDRSSKRSSYSNYFNSFQEAKDFLLEDASGQVKKAQLSLKNALSKRDTVLNMRPNNG